MKAKIFPIYYIAMSIQAYHKQLSNVHGFIFMFIMFTGSVYIAMIDDNSAFVSLDCEEKADDGLYHLVFAFLNVERSFSILEYRCICFGLHSASFSTDRFGTIIGPLLQRKAFAKRKSSASTRAIVLTEL